MAVKTAARRLLQEPKSAVWAKRLDKALGALVEDQDLAAKLRRVIARKTGARLARLEALRGTLQVRAYLRDVSETVRRTGEFEATWLTTIRALAEIDVAELAPRGARWPDPGLANLVAALTSTWFLVTGRTAGLISDYSEPDAKKCPFCEWLVDIIETIGLPRPPLGRIVDIVRALKSEKPAP